MFLPSGTGLPLGKWPIPSELKQSYLQIVHGENYPPLCCNEIAGWIFHTGYYLREQQIVTKLLDKEAWKHSQPSQEIMAETVCTWLLFPVNLVLGIIQEVDTCMRGPPTLCVRQSHQPHQPWFVTADMITPANAQCIFQWTYYKI